MRLRTAFLLLPLAVASVSFLGSAPLPAQEPGEAAPEVPRLSPQEFSRLWWSEIRAELLVGIELDADQQGRVDAIGERAVADALEAGRLRRAMAAAERQQDAERARLLRLEARRFRVESQPSRRVDEIRALLGEAQRVRFDENTERRTARRAAAQASPESLPQIPD